VATTSIAWWRVALLQQFRVDQDHRQRMAEAVEGFARGSRRRGREQLPLQSQVLAGRQIAARILAALERARDRLLVRLVVDILGMAKQQQLKRRQSWHGVGLHGMIVSTPYDRTQRDGRGGAGCSQADCGARRRHGIVSQGALALRAFLAAEIGRLDVSRH
jgi:hypothetical protein